MTTDDADEIARLYRDSVAEVFAYCLRRLFVAHLAEDATAAVFLRLVERYPELKGRSRLQWRHWLYGTASNAVAGALRDARRQSEIAAELARRRETSAAGGERLDWPVLYQALGSLSERHQALIVLRYFQGLSAGDAAAALGIRHVTARVQLSRAVKKLRRTLGNSFGDDHGAL